MLVSEAERRSEASTPSEFTTLLDAMARGGFRDHLAGGFHRSAVEQPPGPPRFEKRLSDNALLIEAYANAYARTGNLLYRDVVRDTVSWAIRDLREPEGCFLASLGAPNGYYLWTRQEVFAVLGHSRGEQFLETYGVEPPGLLTLTGSPFAGLGPSREVLQARRARRVRPPVDDRVVVGWNGLMVSALATSGSLLKRGADTEAARRAAQAVLLRLGPATGLKHEASGPRTGSVAELGDYAYLAEGLLDLHQASGEPRWRDEAVALVEAAVLRLWDVGGGGFFESEAGATAGPRLKSARDRDLPAPNGVIVSVLIRLATLTGDERFRRLAVKTVDTFRQELEREPKAFQTLAAAAARLSTVPSPSPPAPSRREGPGGSSETR
jgi:hypothetical protein